MTKLDTKLEIHTRAVENESSNELKNSNIGVLTRRKRSSALPEAVEDNSGPYNMTVNITIILKILSSTSMIQRYTKKKYLKSRSCKMLNTCS